VTEPHFKIDDCDPPYEFVNVERTSDHPVPEEYRARILLHTPHDGGYIPPLFLYKKSGEPKVNLDTLDRAYIAERDWGANLVAHKIAAAMGVAGYARNRLARVLMDFNRFPGSTPPGNIAPLERLAINRPFTTVLNHVKKVRLLEGYYDTSSDFFEKKLLTNKLIMIAVHTYDERNLSMTRRPHLSILSGMLNYQTHSRMPYGVFDPMYPDVLGESTCSPILRDRIALNLERTGFRVAHNHPYPLPEGSLEVRAQVWYFFDFLRKRFELAHPDTIGDNSYLLVWTMLLNTNLRLGEAESLRSYLHRFRKVSRRRRGRYAGARTAYDRVQCFLHDTNVLHEFRMSKERPSSLGVEVRKDQVCSFDADGNPLPPTPEQVDKATLIGNVIASAITTYFETDRQFL